MCQMVGIGTVHQEVYDSHMCDGFLAVLGTVRSRDMKTVFLKAPKLDIGSGSITFMIISSLGM